MRNIFLSLLMLTIVGCETSVPNTPISAKNTFIVTSANSSNDGSDLFCKDFNLSQSQAEKFFNRGHEINGIELHQSYDWLNCFVKGSLSNTELNMKNCSYSIQAGGTAAIVCQNSLSVLWACDTCEDLLPVAQ